MLTPVSQPSSFSSALTSVGPSSYRDRTAELFSIAEGLQKAPPLPGAANGDVTSGFARSAEKSLASVPGGGSPGGIVAAGGPAASSAASAVQSEFNRRASRIGLCIHQTTQKLQKLAKLAKRTSMFDDPTAEIQDLTAVIKQDITALNASISDLQALCEAQAEASGGKKGQNRHTSEHSNTVVDNLKSRLMNTTKEFKDVLTMRTENLKVHENRRQLFSATSGIAGASGARQRPAAAALAAAPPPWAASSGTPSATSASQLFSNTPSSSSTRRSHPFDPLQQQGQQQALIAQQDSYMSSRSEALQNVETTIVELSTIFRDLATMVAQQGEMAIRIDQDMDDTLTNVEGAQGALLKYLNNISSNRWLIIKIFFVLIIFLLIFVVFVA
ncbi:hypothetical protein CLOM_g20940 [Closterium sp. NIES-68]|nr:hypothetical protein CLOM_g20940 [Closterium sp. NIES-68]GJP80993.1 hypothetical protein CLOP_g11179 [Closterium sp. NIES-67]